ncbi:perilipin-2 [Pelodytes ibericus]
MTSAIQQQQQQNVFNRIINLPLVSSTYEKFITVYGNTKDNHPYLKSVCDMAEKSVKVISSVAMASADPILQKLGPQLSVANDLACLGLDKVEQKLPLLYQPSDKVVSSATNLVVGAKDGVLNCVTDVADKTKSAVYERVQDGKSRGLNAFNRLKSTVTELTVNVNDANKWLFSRLAGDKENDGECDVTARGAERLSLMRLGQGIFQTFQAKRKQIAADAISVYQKSHLPSAQQVYDYISTNVRHLRKYSVIDIVADFSVNNTPLNWLVPDFNIVDRSEPNPNA